MTAVVNGTRRMTYYTGLPSAAKSFVMGRGANGRPVLQHMTRDAVTSVCGRNLSFMGTRFYMARPIPALLCLRCARTEGIDVNQSMEGS